MSTRNAAAPAAAPATSGASSSRARSNWPAASVRSATRTRSAAALAADTPHATSLKRELTRRGGWQAPELELERHVTLELEPRQLLRRGRPALGRGVKGQHAAVGLHDMRHAEPFTAERQVARPARQEARVDAIQPAPHHHGAVVTDAPGPAERQRRTHRAQPIAAEVEERA